MPPRFAYWTILAGGLPTAFRAAEREELLPTFNRLKEKQPDAEMKYFARGKLWDSAEEARRSLERERRGEAARPRERRGPDWRPGGAHRDPRQPFKDAKKARNQERRQERWENRHRDEAKPPRQEFRRRPSRERAASGRRAPASKPHGDPFRGEVPPDRGRRPYQPKNAGRGGRSGPPRPDRRGTDERPQRPPRPPGPNREPRPGKEPSPYPPPKPNEPKIETPPPERGRKRRS